MSDRTCGTCQHWVCDEWGENGVCGIRAAQWVAREHGKRGYGPGPIDIMRWAVGHLTDCDAPACKRWKAFEREELG